MARFEGKNLQGLLDSLILAWEHETVEFKNPTKPFPVTDLGKYFSALANEANLRNQENAWMVFGVDDKTRKIVGTDIYRKGGELEALKVQVSNVVEPKTTFQNIYELVVDGCRVLFFQISPAPIGIPISCNGHYYGRSGESLGALGVAKQDKIRNQKNDYDWTAQIVSDATIGDLDVIALQRSRQSFAKKYENRFSADEVLSCSDTTFLDRSKLTISGKITKAALLLLGKEESSHFLLPHPVQMTWKLEGEERAYQHFGPPFFLNTTQLYQKIRNVQIRILPQNELFPVEVAKYDQRLILEALHNCIAHQDYSQCARIVITENSDRLIFENSGSFFEGMPLDYVYAKKTPRRYRNPFLVQAMVSLNMIDTMGIVR